MLAASHSQANSPQRPLLFTAGTNHTAKDIEKFRPLFQKLEAAGFRVYLIEWAGFTRITELEERIVNHVAKLIQIHPNQKIVLSGHSGGAYATVNAASTLVAEGLGDLISGLLLVSLSPWFDPVFPEFMKHKDYDYDLKTGAYDPIALGLIGAPLPKLNLPITLVYGKEEDFYMHWQGWEAYRHWGEKNSELEIVREADHSIAKLGSWLRI